MKTFLAHDVPKFRHVPAHALCSIGVSVLAVQHKTGVMQFNPPADTSIEAGDVLIAMGERPKLRLLEEEIGRPA